MFKITLISMMMVFVGLISKSSFAQETQFVSAKIEGKRYEFSFSAPDYAKVKTMETYVVNITVAKNIIFDDNALKVVVTTAKELEYNIIHGKFKKQEVELLTFEKL
jgi:hypothetical protein